MPPLELILEADLKCAKCQDKVANAISGVADVEAMEVHLLSKKVILTSKSTSTSKESPRKAATSYKHNNNKLPRKALGTTVCFPSYKREISG